MNIIECTIKMRQGARDNFSRLAGIVADRDARQVFTLLAAAEEEHIARLRALNERFSALAPAFEDACVYRSELATDTSGALAADPDGYRHVLQEEEETIGLLSELAARTDRAGVKEALLAVAEQEREHLLTMENLYAFVDEPRTYLAWGEFSNLRTL
jgi:rubrerythrin